MRLHKLDISGVAGVLLLLLVPQVQSAPGYHPGSANARDDDAISQVTAVISVQLSADSANLAPVALADLVLSISPIHCCRSLQGAERTDSVLT